MTERFASRDSEYVYAYGAHASRRFSKGFIPLAHLDLSGNPIGVEGSLTYRLLLHNDIGDAAQQSLQDAVEGRQGFELYL